MIRIGVDIGGTNIKLGIIRISSGEPKIIDKDSFPFDRVSNDILCKRIYEHTVSLLKKNNHIPDDIEMIGLSVPGCIDKDGEILLHAYNMGYHNQPVKKELSKYFPGKKIEMLNDANAAVLAEFYAGALKGCNTSILLTLGTGLGSGFIINGRLFNGGQNRGTEFGHMPFKKGDIPCTCGMSGCIERYTCASWLINAANERLGGGYTQAKEVFDAAKAWNPVALEILNEYIDNLATVLTGLCNTFDPDRIAIGGGISAAGDVLFDKLEGLIEQRTFTRTRYKIVPAHFLNDAGVLGSVLV